jgi:hypothetical protein
MIRLSRTRSVIATDDRFAVRTIPAKRIRDIGRVDVCRIERAG